MEVQQSCFPQCSPVCHEELPGVARVSGYRVHNSHAPCLALSTLDVSLVYLGPFARTHTFIALEEGGRGLKLSIFDRNKKRH